MRLRRFSVLAGMVVALVAGLSVGASRAVAASCPWMNAQQTPAKRTSELLGAMSLSDKIQMVTGEGEFNPTTAESGSGGQHRREPRAVHPRPGPERCDGRCG